jgi:abequosyltransferase
MPEPIAEVVRSRPLLTIAVPTYNRSNELTQLLTLLEPQLRNRPEIDFYISDNASPDGTQNVIQRFVAAGMPIRYHRHAENIGSDSNFVSCFHAARGTYFWLFGDDDLILPGTIDEILGYIGNRANSSADLDIIYVTGYGFKKDYLSESHGDPLHRSFHTITSPLQFVRVVNTMFTFISGIIVNRDRLLDLPRATGITVEDPSAFLSTNLTQLSWTFPLLRAHRRSLVIWDRLIAGRQGNSGGYSVGDVFGEKLVNIAHRLLPDEPILVRTISNFAIRRWFPNAIYEIRSSGNQGLEGVEAALQKTFGGNFRYWLFVYPALKLPLPAARLWVKIGMAISKILYILLVPTFWRKKI